uniref:UORF n=1 Tax=Oncorhynchus mykiss TaxID=8022 RepID=Q3ZTA1_ONCMY|nr:uORF [Oncorhynchus mykiss]AAS84126.1 uORF [Oncorhynchus mykiss]AAS84128.1 uORF [Oncorhynchus mykiss]AAS84130.1 uORF [Oncorhynchus mykiss]AAS84132.1 uORF [Oncorhynchus mykiss]
MLQQCNNGGIAD